MSLDSAGTGQTAYHLFVNPSGSQMDAINTSASGEQFDADLVWYSVAKITSDGYVVEMQVPLQTLRFSGGDNVRMGILFFRKISRMGVSYSWPEMLPGQWVFDRPGHLLFDQPDAAAAVRAAAERHLRHQPEPGDGGPVERRPTAKPDLGASGKFGITSNITLDGTINPDFSQVESDSFQVQVNQRFPTFFSEKRPFFMEGMGLFNIAGTGGDSNMRTAVHTRRIINPFWGTKLTGTAGKTTFGLLNALDESPEDMLGKRHRRGSQQVVHDRPRDLCAAPLGLHRRHHHGHGIRRWLQPGHWRRSLDQVLVAAAAVGDVPAFPDGRHLERRHGRRRRRRCPTATTRAGFRGRTRSSTTAETFRWIRRSTTGPASRPDGRLAR